MESVPASDFGIGGSLTLGVQTFMFSTFQFPPLFFSILFFFLIKLRRGSQDYRMLQRLLKMVEAKLTRKGKKQGNVCIRTQIVDLVRSSRSKQAPASNDACLQYSLWACSYSREPTLPLKTVWRSGPPKAVKHHARFTRTRVERGRPAGKRHHAALPGLAGSSTGNRGQNGAIPCETTRA